MKPYEDKRMLTPVDAEVPELDTDVGTGLEGDVEARCFSECHYLDDLSDSLLRWALTRIRTRLAP